MENIFYKNAKGTVRFSLPKGKNQIYLTFYFDNKRVRISTKQELTPNLWNEDTQRAKQTLKNPNHAQINQTLNEMENKIVEVFDKFIADYGRKPNPDELKNIFNNEYFEQIPQFTTKKPKSLLETFDEYIETKRVENPESTVRKYMQTKDNLMEFGKIYKQEIQFENITMGFRNKYVHFLQETKGYAPSTVHRKLKFFKTILIYALDNGYIQSLNINLKKFLTKDQQSDKIALSGDELRELENLDLSKTPRLERVRDRFLIGCYTGFRFSDFNRLDKSHIKDGKYITIQQKKTKNPVTIPFFDNVRQVFEKYNYNLPKSISMQKFNDCLKEIAQRCESLSQLQEVTKFIGNREIKATEPRYSLVSTHTARRTFVTLNAAKGVDLETLTIATGHTSVKSLKAYIKLNDKQRADVLGNAFERAETQRQEKTAKIIPFNVANQ